MNINKNINKARIICFVVIAVTFVLVTLFLSIRFNSYSKEALFNYESQGENYVFVTVEVYSKKDPKKLQDFSINLNDKNIFIYDDLYRFSTFKQDMNVSLYLYNFQKQDLNNLYYKLVFVVNSSLLHPSNKLVLSMQEKNYSLGEIKIEKMNGAIDDKLAEMYKQLELISYYKEQVSMDYKNIYLAYSGYNNLKRLIVDNKLDPFLVDQAINNFKAEESLITLITDIVDEINFDAQRKLILSNEDKAKERYLELLSFYKANRMVQSLDIEEVLAGG